MVQFIQKRLQVFVSSTYTDLIEERQAAVESILTAGHIPAGMELFTAGDESQMDVIKQWIDESDVFLLILGGRYGSVEPKSEKSYTQLEYEYAITKGKPLFACVVTDSAQERRVKHNGTSVVETNNPQKLKEFRNFVLTKVVKFWEDPKDIKIAVGEKLAQLSRSENLLGWVRPHQEANMPALADEITRLSKENASLRSQLERYSSDNKLYNGLSFEEVLSILEREEIVDSLSTNRGKLGDYIYKEDVGLTETQISELCVLGLFQADSHSFNGRRYKLTDSGRMFLNRLTVRTIS
jgi:nucleoside 2-deoxyribosyltransferase